ncbi:MAG: AmmeMemoRadiSam system protein B, partial [Candidatus Aenigmatarchaeota archaeon]
MGMKTRYPTASGYFYPSSPDDLKKMIDGFLDDTVKVKIPGKLKALIVPHAGYIYSGIVAAAGYRLLEHMNIKRILLLGPSHSYPLSGAAIT